MSMRMGIEGPRPSLYAAIEALKDAYYMRKNVRRVIAERERICSKLNELAVQAYQSFTNFLLVKADIPDVAGKFKDIGILISDLSDRLPSGFIRVSTGTREENEAFITGYMKICEAYDRRQLFGLAP